MSAKAVCFSQKSSRSLEQHGLPKIQQFSPHTDNKQNVKNLHLPHQLFPTICKQESWKRWLGEDWKLNVVKDQNPTTPKQSQTKEVNQNNSKYRKNIHKEQRNKEENKQKLDDHKVIANTGNLKHKRKWVKKDRTNSECVHESEKNLVGEIESIESGPKFIGNKGKERKTIQSDKINETKEKVENTETLGRLTASANSCTTKQKDFNMSSKLMRAKTTTHQAADLLNIIACSEQSNEKFKMLQKVVFPPSTNRNEAQEFMTLTQFIIRSNTETLLNTNKVGTNLAHERAKSCVPERRHDGQRHKRQKDKVTLYHLNRYKSVVEIYLDSNWHRARKIRLHNFAQQVKKRQENERKKENKKKAVEVMNSAKRQREQLQYLRSKHSAEKKKRIATQHVKWKFVQGLDDDREQYGLPNSTQD